MICFGEGRRQFATEIEEQNSLSNFYPHTSLRVVLFQASDHLDSETNQEVKEV